ncbi:MAG: GNAT family N-acetyltransferase [Candidatus Berkiella sp.]
MDLNQFKLVPATLDDYPIIQNMGRFYVYDMSEYVKDGDWAIPQNGLYECIDFKKYWLDENAWPFLIHYQQELAGFVIVDKKGADPKTDYNMAQFFILRRFKGQGVGKHIAKMCFNQFKGRWEVMVIPNNSGAYQFWKRTIKEYSTGKYTESKETVAHFSHSEKMILRFSSEI